MRAIRKLFIFVNLISLMVRFEERKLTKDHIVPISKKGIDYIQNIQPLCISCNARKKDEEVSTLWLK